MKNLLLLCTLCVLFVGCGGDDPIPTPTSGLSINDASLNITLAETETSARVHFTAYENWTATIEAADNWCSISPSQGTAGDVTMNLQAQGNTTSDTQTAKITLTAGAMTKVINVIRGAGDVLTIKQDNYAVALEGGEIEVVVESNVEYSYLLSKEDKLWITPTKSPSTAESRALTTKTFRFHIAPFEEQGRREGKIVFTDNKIRREVAVIQGTNYESTDFSADGQVIELQKATEGNGINIVLMGDAFSDRLIADGTYEKVMRKGMEAFFSEEPYPTFRKLFNVYAVNVVSRNEEYFSGASTKLNGWFGEGTAVGGADKKCESYVYKVPGMTLNKYYDTLVIIMMNKKAYAGTCYMDYNVPENDFGRGTSLAYFPLGTDEAMFTQLLTHEAGGHGFSKLGDEYFYESQGRIPENEVTDFKKLVSKYGWLKNVDITNEPAKIKWSKFLTDPRYKNTGIGIFEGGHTYYKGVWRPTKADTSSIMIKNVGGFNAPARESIYYRIHKLAYGADWVYNYEDFVKYDAINRTEAAQMKRTMAARNIPQNFEPLHAPVMFYGDHQR